jgi:hypothetical protein
VLSVLEGAGAVVGCKVSEDGTGVVVRMANYDLRPQRVTIETMRQPASAWALLPDERKKHALTLAGHRLTVEVAPRCTKSVLLEWAEP